ncbi:MAG: MATE family efflux transporter [Rikenellaceae bacterium]
MKLEKGDALISGKVTKSLVSFTIPILFALFLQIMYGAIDMFIVGNFAQINDVSGVSTGSQFINTLTSLCIGLSMGTTILIGQKRGERKDSEIGSVISNSIMLFMAMSIVIMTLMLIFNHAIVDMMNTPDTAVIKTRGYIFYSSLGIPMIFAYNILGSIFRGLGDSKTPLMAVAIACAVNVIGDLILVAYCGMGAPGAAIATILAQTISVVVSIYIIRKKSLFTYKMNRSTFALNMEYIKRIIVLGVPIALQSVLTSISFLFVMLIVNKFGVIFSAAVGVIEKLIGSMMLIPLSFMQSISVFVAQNYGARNFNRMKQGVKVGMIISVSTSLLMAYLSIFHGEIIISIFNQDPQVLAAAKSYLNAYVIDVVLVAFLFCLTGYLTGSGATMYVMIQGVVGAVIVRLTLTYVLSLIEPVSLFRIGLATPAATIIQIAMCVVFLNITNKRIKSYFRKKTTC